MNSNSKYIKLRALLKSPGRIIKVAGAHDGLSARLVEASRMDAVWASSLEISTSHGVPDTNVLTMEQYLERAIEMNNATSIPVIADCSLGYRDNDNILEVVRRYESVGIAAVTIEEKRLPKSNSLISRSQELVPKEEFVSVIQAIKTQRRKTGITLIARVEAFIAGKGLDEVLIRAVAYADAGADVILVHSRSPQPDEIIDFTKRWRQQVPLAVIPTTYYSITAEKLQQLGIKMVIYANHGLRAEIKAVTKTFKTIIETGSSVSVESSIASIKDIFKLQRPLR